MTSFLFSVMSFSLLPVCVSGSAASVICSGFWIFHFIVLSHLRVFAQSLVMLPVFYGGISVY